MGLTRSCSPVISLGPIYLVSHANLSLLISRRQGASCPAALGGRRGRSFILVMAPVLRAGELGQSDPRPAHPEVVAMCTANRLERVGADQHDLDIRLTEMLPFGQAVRRGRPSYTIRKWITVIAMRLCF